MSQWFDLGGTIDPMDAYNDGSEIDRTIFLSLIVAGIIILVKRRINWIRFLSDNRWICLFVLFCGISILWSDDSFISLKRWIKAIGSVVMVLLILSEERPYEAVGALLRKLAFILIPLSILLIRYFPEYGRVYHQGIPMFTGASTQKNTLGAVLLITGIYFCWNIIVNRRGIQNNNYGWHKGLDVVFIALIVWLSYLANSATALACLIISIGVLLVSRIPAISYKPRRLIILSAVAMSILLLLEWTFGIYDMMISTLGRDETLTTRMPLWEMLLQMDTNPLLGEGYEIFWSGSRMLLIWEKWPDIIQSHNGYLELYLNVGLIGLSIFILSIISGLMSAFKHLSVDYAEGMLKLTFILAVVLNNWTEASIKPVSNMFIVYLIGILDITNLKRAN